MDLVVKNGTVVTESSEFVGEVVNSVSSFSYTPEYLQIGDGRNAQV